MDLRSAPAGTAPACSLDEKTRKLFLKLRKGADASLSLGQLFKVLGRLGGWTVEEIVGLTAFHFDKVRVHFAVESEERAREVHMAYASRIVAKLPERRVLGQSYVMELGELVAQPNYYKPNHFGASCLLWLGSPGYRITAPTGELFEIVPTWHDFSDGSMRDFTTLPTLDVKAAQKRLRPWDALKWLKRDTDYLRQISAALGMEEHVPAAQRTRDNTGTCGCCFRNIKLDQDHQRAGHPTMALHGYQRPGDGFIRGRCSGGYFPPFELSVEATTIELGLAKYRMDGAVRHLAKVESPDFAEFTTYDRDHRPTVHRKSDVDWGRLVADVIASAKRAVESTEVEHATFSWLVEHWEPRALPTAGSQEPDYWTPAWRAVLAARKDQE